MKCVQKRAKFVSFDDEEYKPYALDRKGKVIKRKGKITKKVEPVQQTMEQALDKVLGENMFDEEFWGQDEQVQKMFKQMDEQEQAEIDKLIDLSFAIDFHLFDE